MSEVTPEEARAWDEALLHPDTSLTLQQFSQAVSACRYCSKPPNGIWLCNVHSRILEVLVATA